MSRGYQRKVEQLFEEQRAHNLRARPGPHDFALVLDHLEPDFNPGKIFRSADAFGCRRIHLVGLPFFDPAPAMGSFKHVPALFHDTFAEAEALLRAEGYQLYALMPNAGPSLYAEKLPDRSAFVLGNEVHGLSFDPALYPGIRPLRIPQFGNPQSLNVSVAASLAMYEWVRQRNVDPGPQGKTGRH